MPQFKEIADGGPNPNTPTIEEMRESQNEVQKVKAPLSTPLQSD